MPNRYAAFISYAHRYAEWVARLQRNLEACLRAAGCEPTEIFLDQTELDPGLPVADLQPMEQVFQRSVSRPRFLAFLLAAFAAVGLGLAAGLVLAVILTQRLMPSLLFGVGLVDPVTFVTVPALLAAVAFIACYLPARRATRVDPVRVLRHE